MTHDVQRHFDTATAFFLSAERSSFDLSFGAYGFHSIGAPTIANYAFSVELALKLLHVLMGGEQPQGHWLKAFFDALPEETRRNLPELAASVSEISTDFADWRYAFEKDFLIALDITARRGFIECYREIRRIRPDLLSIYEQIWGRFEPDWYHAWQPGQKLEGRASYFFRP